MEDSPFVANANRFFCPPQWREILFFLLPKPLLQFSKFTVHDPNAANFFVDVARHIIEKRNANGEVHNDYLQLLIDAAKDLEEIDLNNNIGSGKNCIAFSHRLSKTAIFLLVDTKKSRINRLNKTEMLAQVVQFFVAGFEASRWMLSFIAYLLAINPDCQDRLYEELAKAVEEGAIDENGSFDYNILNSLPYLDAIVSESLRLYNPVVAIQRLCINDYKLGL